MVGTPKKRPIKQSDALLDILTSAIEVTPNNSTSATVALDAMKSILLFASGRFSKFPEAHHDRLNALFSERQGLVSSTIEDINASVSDSGIEYLKENFPALRNFLRSTSIFEAITRLCRRS